jgi:hypothetical protein
MISGLGGIAVDHFRTLSACSELPPPPPPPKP